MDVLGIEHNKINIAYYKKKDIWFRRQRLTRNQKVQNFGYQNSG
jgi:hypothetical protein